MKETSSWPVVNAVATGFLILDRYKFQLKIFIAMVNWCYCLQWLQMAFLSSCACECFLNYLELRVLLNWTRME